MNSPKNLAAQSQSNNLAVVVKTVLGFILVGIGELTTQFGTYFSGVWDARWKYDLGFDPWPFRAILRMWV